MIHTLLSLLRTINGLMLYSFGHLCGCYLISCFYVYDKKKRQALEDKVKPLSNEAKFKEKYKNIIIRKLYFDDDYDSSDETSDDSDCESIELYEKPKHEHEYVDFFKKKSVKIEHETYKTMHMMWNPENNQFIYFCRTREVPYKVLDVLCRKFVLTYDLCDKYVINFHHEYKNDNDDNDDNIVQDSGNDDMKDGHNDMKDGHNNDDDDECEIVSDDCDDFEEIKKENVSEPPMKNSVFSMLKKTEERKKNQEKYNKNINVFKYGGNIFDFDELVSESSTSSSYVKKQIKNINYMQFKFEKDPNLKME